MVDLFGQPINARLCEVLWMEKDEKRRNDSELVLFNDYFERGRERSNKQSDGERTCSVSLEETKEWDLRAEVTAMRRQRERCSQTCSGPSRRRESKITAEDAIPWPVTLTDSLVFAILGSGETVIAVTFRERITPGV